MSSAETQKQAEAQYADSPKSLLESALQKTKESGRDEARDAVAQLVKWATKGSKTIPKSSLRMVEGVIKDIDDKLSQQLRVVMHSEKFRKLEGSWRGLHYLVDQTETAVDLKIRVLNCSKNELRKDLERAVEFDQSEVFKRIYRDEFGTAGGESFGSVVGDFEIENTEDDLSMLSKMSQVAASGFCPFLTSPAPSLFQLDNWTELPNPRDLALRFQGPKYIKWNAFRDSEDSRFVAMALPRVLARTPYGSGGKKIDEFNYEEVDLDADGAPLGQSHHDFCWMNASYTLATKITQCYSQTGFVMRVLGKNSGGRVEDLPVFTYRDNEGKDAFQCPTEINIDDRRANEMAGLGFMPLVHWKNTDVAAFITGDTSQKPKVYDRPQANENAQASAWLPYILACGRFSHYLKAYGRDLLGSMMERGDVEEFLDRWIKNYVCAIEKPDDDTKARLPLMEARVEVEPVAGELGAYNARIWMRPWTQLRQLTAAMSMVTRIPKPAGG